MQETKATATQRNEQLQPELAEQVIPSQPGLPYVNPAANKCSRPFTATTMA